MLNLSSQWCFTRPFENCSRVNIFCFKVISSLNIHRKLTQTKETFNASRPDRPHTRLMTDINPSPFFSPRTQTLSLPPSPSQPQNGMDLDGLTSSKGVADPDDRVDLPPLPDLLTLHSSPEPALQKKSGRQPLDRVSGRIRFYSGRRSISVSPKWS